MRLLQWFKLHRHVIKGIKLAMKIENLLSKPAHDELQAFHIHELGFGGIVAVHGQFDLRSAATKANVEAPAAHLVEHADLFDQAHRMVKRQRVNQRSETKPIGS